MGALAVSTLTLLVADGSPARTAPLNLARPIVAGNPDPGGYPVAQPVGAPPGRDWSTTPAPTRLRIRRIGLDAPLERLRLNPKGVLEPPVDFDRPGWYAGGTAPGEPGPAVIAGHVDSYTGPAVFARLTALRPGDLIEVERGKAWVPFRVASAVWYPKDRFPTATVYGPTPDAQLRLLTCGGEFDDTLRSYRDNLVVYAVGA